MVEPIDAAHSQITNRNSQILKKTPTATYIAVRVVKIPHIFLP